MLRKLRPGLARYQPNCTCLGTNKTLLTLKRYIYFDKVGDVYYWGYTPTTAYWNDEENSS